MIKLIKRSVETAIKLPFSLAWDAISLGNMGEGSSTGKVLKEHQVRKEIDDLKEILEILRQ